MDYKESLEYLYRQLPMFSRVGAAAYKPGLDTSLNLDAYFGHPHNNFKSIHIGGTNGKGSTSNMLAAILQSQGYKVGLYTSPHLVDFRERIRVDGKMIPQEEVVDFVERFRNSAYNGHPSFFELTMMMAFDYFSRSKVDYAIIEVGMGGRLDSTNIITPIASVITNISWDHTQFLGDTLLKIAGEKAGIIKTDIPVVIGEADGEIRSLFLQKANEVETKIIFAEDNKIINHFTDSTDFVANNGNFYRCELKGDYQRKNIATVMTTVEMLRQVGVKIDETSVVEGLEHVSELTGFAGRWMKINDEPMVICDTGHNQAGLTYNMHQLAQLMSDRDDATLRIVMGFVADKDVDHIIQMFPESAKYYISNAQIPRALPVAELAEKCVKIGIQFKSYPSVREAYDEALSESCNNDIIYVGGSTFVVADLLASFEK